MGDIIEVEEPILIDEPKIVDIKTDAPKRKCEQIEKGTGYSKKVQKK